MTHEDIYEQADKEVTHWQHILMGSLSPQQRHAARLMLLRATARRVIARNAIEQNVSAAA